MVHSRRRWLLLLSLLTAGILAAGLGALTAGAPVPPSVMAVRVPGMDVSRHQVPAGVMAPRAGRERVAAIFLVREGDGWAALSDRSGDWRECSIRWEEAASRFVDPCFGNVFNRYGEAVGGIAERGLYRFPVRPGPEGFLEVDLSQPEPGPRHVWRHPRTSLPTPATATVKAAREYLAAQATGAPAESLEIMREEAHAGGLVVVISFRVGGKRVVDLLWLDPLGKITGAAANGKVAVIGEERLPVAWTWLGAPGQSDYVLYGPVAAGPAYSVEITEADGTVTAQSIQATGVWILIRGKETAITRLRALGYRGDAFYERRF